MMVQQIWNLNSADFTSLYIWLEKSLVASVFKKISATYWAISEPFSGIGHEVRARSVRNLCDIAV